MANYDKKYNFNYYKIYKNNELFDFKKWIDNFKIDNILQNYLDYETFKVRCDGISEVNNSERWILHFARLNPDDDPLVTGEKNSEIKKVKLGSDQILTNELFSLYDSKNKVFICQNVRNSISITIMTNYINYFWRKYSNDVNSILEIKPILQTRFLDTLSKQQNIKKVSMKIANPPLMDRVGSPKSIDRYLNEAEGVDSSYINLEFGIGSDRNKKSLNFNGVLNLAKSIMGMNDDLVQKLEIIGDDRLKPIDLVNGKIKRTITLAKAEYVDKDQSEITNNIRIKMQKTFTTTTIEKDILEK